MKTEESNNKTFNPPEHQLTLLVILLSLLLVVGVYRAFDTKLLRAGQETELSKAASAISSLSQNKSETTQKIRMPGGGLAGVRLGPRYSPGQALNTVLRLEAARHEYLSLVATASRRMQKSREDAAFAEAVQRARRKREEAAVHLDEFLLCGKDRARVVLCALGWPSCTPAATVSAQTTRPGLPADVPVALRNLSPAKMEAVLHTARKPQEPWLETSARLAKDFCLTSQQIEVLQLWLCRKALQEAFSSDDARDRAHITLERHAALSSAQVRTVIAMRGAQKLLESGHEAVLPLTELMRTHPDVARVILHVLSERWGLRNRAVRALQKLHGSDSEAAEAELLALGPFAVEAILQMHNPAENGKQVRDILLRLRNRWPTGNTAMDILGHDPDSWRRWYREARSILQEP